MQRIEFGESSILVLAGKSSEGTEYLLEAALKFSENNGIHIQLMDSIKIFGIEHIQSAFEKAVRAFKNGTNSSNSLVTETMLYISGRRQIQEAVITVGLSDETESIVMISEASDNKAREIKEALLLEEDESLLSAEKKDPRALGISEKELSTLSKEKTLELVLELVAGVDIIKK